MNKKYFLSLLMLACTSLLWAQAEAETAESEVKGIHPWKVAENSNVSTDLSHWSLSLGYGFSSFDGDFNSEMKHPVYTPTIDLNVEYSFTPIWGLGVSYTFDRYRVTGDVDAGNNAPILLAGLMHKAGAYISLDLFNCFFPRADHKLLSLFVMGGGGAGWYKNDIYFPGNDDQLRNQTGSLDPSRMDEYKCLPYLQGGIGCDFNVCRSLAIGLRGMYAYYTKDVIDGRGVQGMRAVASKNNDGIFDITLQLRYKIDAEKHSHVRNMPSYQLIDAQLADNRPVKKDTIVIFHKDTIVCNNEVRIEEKSSSDIPGKRFYVYFDNDKSNLNEPALQITQQVAELLNNNPDLYVDVIGYCDNTGTEAYNEKLAIDRARRVLDELKEEFGVPESHFLTSGRGKVVGRRSKKAYAPNRRAEIRIMTKDEFEALQRDRSKVTITQQGALFRDKESVNQTTLTQIARRTWGNPSCWIYLYQYNLSKIPDVENLPAGINIDIPQITEEQKKITKEEAMRIFNDMNGGKSDIIVNNTDRVVSEPTAEN